jgi:hypothetical protein
MELFGDRDGAGLQDMTVSRIVTLLRGQQKRLGGFMSAVKMGNELVAALDGRHADPTPGLFFYTVDEDGLINEQGIVVRTLRDGVAGVRLYGWMDGEALEGEVEMPYARMAEVFTNARDWRVAVESRLNVEYHGG